MEGATPDSDQAFAEWYVWAKREVSSDPRVCLGVAQAAVESLQSGADRAAAERAARRSVAGTAVVLLARVSPWRQGYARWYDWARLEFGGDAARLHRLTQIAIQRLKVDGDGGQAAAAARSAAAADPPAVRPETSSPTAPGPWWPQSAGATPGGWGGVPFSGSTAAMGTATHLALASTSAVTGMRAPLGQPGAAFTSSTQRAVAVDPAAYAGFKRRLGATVVDAVVGVVGTALVVFLAYVFWILAVVSNRGASLEQLALTALALLVILAVLFWLYDAGLESSPAQGTIGKRALGLTVVDRYGRPVSFARATVRHVIKSIPLVFGLLLLLPSILLLRAGVLSVEVLVIGLLGLALLLVACVEFSMVAWTRRKQGLHDLIASTVVVRRDLLARVVAATPATPPTSDTMPEPQPGGPAGAVRHTETTPRIP